MEGMIVYLTSGLSIVLALWMFTKIDFVIKPIIAKWSLLRLFLSLILSFLIMIALWPAIVGVIIANYTENRRTDDEEGP